VPVLSFAIAFLHRRGYKVTAISHRKTNHDYLTHLGADSVIDLSEFLAAYRQPLGSERWSGAIDSVGGDVLTALLSGMAYRSGVACCGLARGSEFSANISIISCPADIPQYVLKFRASLTSWRAPPLFGSKPEKS
jgi:NADPH:quinone reductase-like Zn-dependent oxidoreductase